MNRRDALRSILALPVVGPAVLKAAAAEAPAVKIWGKIQWCAPDGSAPPPAYSFVYDTTADTLYRYETDSKVWAKVRTA